MVDQHHAEGVLAPERREDIAEPRELVAMQPAVAASGAVCSEVESPMMLIGPRRRTNGKFSLWSPRM